MVNPSLKHLILVQVVQKVGLQPLVLLGLPFVVPADSRTCMLVLKGTLGELLRNVHSS